MSFRLFERYGIELEYMIVDRETLDVRPIADAILGEAGEVELGRIAWSNELVLHVLEMKCNEPEPALEPLVELFQESVREANRRLEPHGARLLPTAMHPWMDPAREMRLWPHDYGPVYAAFDRIFDCRGHGWANLQSMHVNLPFASSDASDGEFARLHAAIRLVLPILPALAASSPFRDGRASGFADTRLEVYRKNSARVPSVSGDIVPEPVFTRRDYERSILERIYRDVAPHDPEGVLRDEFCNSRGAIARFVRDAIEIRVIDVQEHPRADLGVAALTSSVVEAHCRERWGTLATQKSWEVAPLAQIFLACVERAENAVIDDESYLRAFGVRERRLSAGELWNQLRREVWPAGSTRDAAFRGPIDGILRSGTLSTRIRRVAGPEPPSENLFEVYFELARCLEEGESFAV